MNGPPTAAAIERAKRRDAALEASARILLCRYGVLFRDLLARESNAPKWRDLLPLLRRLEARGEIRGGRFVSGAFGEQFAVPEAVESLRVARRQTEARASEAPITVAAADPLNLVGILVPGERVAAVPGREVQFQNGAAVGEAVAEALTIVRRRTRSVAEMLRAESSATRAPATTAQTGLFG
jgi:ATP-dependent Lhr-like helicase